MRKQMAKEKRSRQSDVMSDLENNDIMLGSFCRKEINSQLAEKESEGHFESNTLQETLFRRPKTSNPC